MSHFPTIARVCFLPWLILSLSLTPSVLAQANSYRIAGKVVSSTSGSPLAQTRVTIALVSDEHATATTVTGDDGAFAFSNLAAGKYSLSAARRGYIESSFNAHDNFSTAIVTGADSDSEHLVFRLTPQVVISGHVLDEYGEPVRNATVSLYRQDRGTGRELIRRIASSNSDDRGIYEFGDLAPGDYFLSANASPWFALRPAGFSQAEKSSAPPSNHSFNVAYPTTYYADTTDSDDATPVPVRGGEHLTIDIRLSSVPALRLVVHPPGGPNGQFAMPQILRKSFDSMENITATIVQSSVEHPEGPAINDSIRPGPNSVELLGIPSGKYTIFVPDDTAGPSEGTLADVELNHDGQELSAASGDPVSSLKFKVHMQSESPIPDQLALVLQSPDHKIAVGSGVRSDGATEFVHMPAGKYNLLAITPNREYSVTSITSSGNRTSGHVVEIFAGSRIQADVTLVRGTGTVQGFARLAGKGIAGAMIVLVPKDPEANGDLFRRDQSDSDGSFSLADVIPGEYTIVAIDDAWDLHWSEPGVLTHYLPQGRRVTVHDGILRLSEDIPVQPK